MNNCLDSFYVFLVLLDCGFVSAYYSSYTERPEETFFDGSHCPHLFCKWPPHLLQRRDYLSCLKCLSLLLTQIRSITFFWSISKSIQKYILGILGYNVVFLVIGYFGLALIRDGGRGWLVLMAIPSPIFWKFYLL